jgi:sugar phosphate isomerase/epimerase
MAVMKTLLGDILELSRISGDKNLKFLLWEQMYAPSEMPYRIKQAKGFFNYLNRKSDIPIKLVIDIGHMCCSEFKHSQDDLNPYKWITELAEHIGIIHIQQTTPLKSHHWPFTEKYNKKGMIDPKKILETLAASGLEEVDLIFEIFFPINVADNSVLEDMKDTVQLWKTEISNLYSKKD